MKLLPVVALDQHHPIHLRHSSADTGAGGIEAVVEIHGGDHTPFLGQCGQLLRLFGAKGEWLLAQDIFSFPEAQADNLPMGSTPKTIFSATV